MPNPFHGKPDHGDEAALREWPCQIIRLRMAETATTGP